MGTRLMNDATEDDTVTTSGELSCEWCKTPFRDGDAAYEMLSDGLQCGPCYHGIDDHTEGK